MNNPFTSELFVTVWSKHFNKSKEIFRFQFIEHVSFYKKKFLPLYITIGKNLTRGIYYSINNMAKDFKNKVFLIYDVPQFFNVESIDISQSSLKRKDIFQYHGFLLDFKDFPTSQDYVNSRISSKNRRGLKSRQERLEKCFNIRYKFYTDDISKEEFDLVFDQFNELLSDRFMGKNVNFHLLGKDVWDFHHELSYEMMKDNKASLFVIYNDKTPIAITLNFQSETVLFVAVTVFDPNFYKFNIGKTAFVKIIEWCYENNMEIADFSKGDFDFKHEWCNVSYDFDYHVLYDSKSMKASFLASLIAYYFKFKLYLRQKDYNTKFRKMQHNLKNIGKKDALRTILNVEMLDDFVPSNDYELIDHLGNHEVLKGYVYAFLFANPEHIDNLQIYTKEGSSEYIIKGTDKAQRLTI